MTHIDFHSHPAGRGERVPPASFARPPLQLRFGAMRRAVEARTVIVEEGEIGDEVFEIIEGMVMTSRRLDDERRVVIDFRGPGDVVGLRHGQRALSTATSLTGVALKPVAGNGRGQPDPDRLLREIELAYRKIGALARMNALERVADFLASYAAASRSDSFELPMKRSEIADALGLTIESVSRSFTEIRKAGLIRFVDGNPYRIQILDGDRIKRFGAKSAS